MDPDLQIKTNTGCKELLLRKLSYAVTCSVLMQIVLLTAFLFTVNINILNPGKWFFSSVSTFTTLSTWLFLVPFLSVIFAQSMICAKDYVLRCTCHPTRISSFFSMFSVRNVVLLCLHTSSGAFFVWLHLSLAGADNLIVKCDNMYRLNEECFYLVLFGVWIGFYYFLRIYSAEKNIIFPVIQQGKLLWFKSNFVDVLKNSQKAAILPVLVYVFLYYLFADASFFADVLSVRKTTLSVNAMTILYAWFYGFLYVFNMKLMRFFFEIFLTEPIEFPILKLNNADLTLTNAMNIDNIPIIQHLSCLDFYLLSTVSPARRQVIFSLSQPGNHPHNWNNLVGNVLEILNAYTQTMTVSINAILSTVKELPADKKPQTTNQFVKNYNFGNMRNMTLNNYDIPVEFVNVTSVTGSPKPTLAEKLQNKINGVISGIKRRTGIYFLFEELPMANIEYLLLNGQIVIWTVQGLSVLTVASLKEDKFGVMQKDLPVILSALTELKLCMEKLNRIPALVRKSQRFDSYTSKMKYSVNSAVKRSLYHICNNFGPYLKDLSINNDLLQTLQTYVH